MQHADIVIVDCSEVEGNAQAVLRLCAIRFNVTHDAARIEKALSKQLCETRNRNEACNDASTDMSDRRSQTQRELLCR